MNTEWRKWGVGSYMKYYGDFHQWLYTEMLINHFNGRNKRKQSSSTPKVFKSEKPRVIFYVEKWCTRGESYWVCTRAQRIYPWVVFSYTCLFSWSLPNLVKFGLFIFLACYYLIFIFSFFIFMLLFSVTRD